MAGPDYEPLFYWVRERENIRHHKEQFELGLSEGVVVAQDCERAKMTTDPILHEWRFCNVRREDDRVTVWVRKNIRERFSDHPYLWLMLCIARQINWPGTLQDLINFDNEGLYHDAWPSKPDFSLEGFESALEDRKSMGFKVYTGAYMISAPSEKGVSKQHYMARTIIGKLWENRTQFHEWFVFPHRTLAKTHERLSRFIGWGDFMSYQAIVDMRFTALLNIAPDIESWCAAGPGTIRGLNRLYNRPLKYALSQEQARSEIRAIWKVIRQETGVEMDFSDVPNCLCETDKYLRVKNGEGTPRARYVPGRGS